MKYINIVPDESLWNGNYLCTWSIQGDIARELGIEGTACSEQRDALTAQTLFGEKNYFHVLSEEYRKDVILLLDDGWDVPFGTPHNETHSGMFGSLIPDQERFKGYGETPVERLMTISQKAKALGYKGIGLWVSPQQANINGPDTPETARGYWEERAKWSNETGVLYWKVDWGFQDNAPYRRMMTEVVREYAPNLYIEHASPRAPFTALSGGQEAIDTFYQEAQKRAPLSDVYRVYDVYKPFYDVCVLERLDLIFKANPKQEYNVKGLINVESAPIIAAAFGCTYGIMHKDENTEACLRWQRIAPAFSMYKGKYVCSDEILTDNFFFENDVCSWIECKGMEIAEKAPAIMARNCKLPIVKAKGEIKPFVIASKNADNGVYSIATLRRTVDPNKNIAALADIIFELDDWDHLIGVFGIMNSLELTCERFLPENITVMVQDIMSNKAIDVTDRVSITNNSIVFNGIDLRMWGKSGRGVANESEPSLIIKLGVK